MTRYKTYWHIAPGQIGPDETASLRYDDEKAAREEALVIFQAGVVKYAKARYVKIVMHDLPYTDPAYEPCQDEEAYAWVVVTNDHHLEWKQGANR